jgi:hypothetical protein
MQLHLFLVWAFFNSLRASLQVGDPYDSESVFFFELMGSPMCNFHVSNLISSPRFGVSEIRSMRRNFFFTRAVGLSFSNNFVIGQRCNKGNALGEVMPINTPSMIGATTLLMSGNSINHL